MQRRSYGTIYACGVAARAAIVGLQSGLIADERDEIRFIRGAYTLHFERFAADDYLVYESGVVSIHVCLTERLRWTRRAWRDSLEYHSHAALCIGRVMHAPCLPS